MVELIIAAVIICLVGGLAYALVSRAPFFQSPFKEWALWLIYACVAIALVIYVLIPLIRILGGALQGAV